MDSNGKVQTTAVDAVNLIEKAGGGNRNSPSELQIPPSKKQYSPLEKLPSAAQDLPASFDWRNYQGADWMSPVKNQGICGSCWAFSAVGITEAVINIDSNNPNIDVNLAEEYLVANCYTGGACDGGWHSSALNYIRNSGVPDEDCLPYLDGRSDGCTYTNGACNAGKCTYASGSECSDYRCSDRCSDWSSRLLFLKSVHSFYSPTIPEIKSYLIENGPLSVAMHWGGTWDGDHVYHCSDSGVNHAVVIVGYDDAGGYWIVRNSWGSSWNGNGYFKVAYNNCDIQKYPAYADFMTCNDPNETNNSSSDATSISYSTSTNANICGTGDIDFYQFTGSTGDKVIVDIDTASSGSALDSYIYLIDSDGSTVLAENDDENSANPDSILGYTLTHSGTYYIKVKDANDAGGENYSYTLNLLTDNTNPPSVEIGSPAENDWLDAATQVITATATDNESGVQRVAFYWHDNAHTAWTWLGDDSDGSDGWSWQFDTSTTNEQQGIAVQAKAYDWAGNFASDEAINLGLDHTPPTVALTMTIPYGDAPFRDVLLDWSDSADNLSGVKNFDVQVRDGTDGTWEDLLAATTETSHTFVGEDGHTYYFRVRARDQSNNESSYTPGDGDAQRSINLCSVDPDPYESDASISEAKGIPTNGYKETHNTHTPGDVDWFQFYAAQGFTYTITTADTNNSGYADTILYLFEDDGSTLIASNDNDPALGYMSRIVWTPTESGIYYLKVHHSDPYADGCATTYDIWITSTQTTTNSFIPFVFR